MFLFARYLAELIGKLKFKSLDKMAAKYVPRPEEAEELILEAITKITSPKSKQRASSEKICSALLRSHGLDEAVVMLQITMMLVGHQ